MGGLIFLALQGGFVILRKILFSYVLTLISFVHADEIPIPEFSGETIKFYNPFGGEFILGERIPEKLKFWFRTVGGNYHQCHMTGVAKSRDNETYKYGQFEQNTHCSLSIIVLGNSVVLIDESHQCKKISCGQRAGINGAVFHRAK
ncbi:hypothetical protein AYI78_21325 [Shewanella algae]|nr:hypothetical protein AYI78_21325 [Shewanella algae]TVO89402.1 hypothetical protein AYI79_21360 [Shewanella algae]